MTTPVQLQTEWGDRTFKWNDLQVGMIYILKNGDVLMYLGINKTNRRYAFYILGSTYLVKTDSYTGYRMLFGVQQANMLFSMCQQILKYGFVYDAIQFHVDLPELRCAWYQAYTVEQLEAICQKYMLFGDTVGNLLKSLSLTVGNGFIAGEEKYTNAEALCPGQFYFSGSKPKDLLFLYVGQLKSRRYAWCIVRTEVLWEADLCAYLRRKGFDDSLLVTNDTGKRRRLTSSPVGYCSPFALELYGKSYDAERLRECFQPILLELYGQDGTLV